jgi:ketose-bisphosphate aldolase
MKTLQEYFADAKTGGWAIGHFNFATADVLRSIIEGAQMGDAPCVMVGTSPGEAQFVGMRAAVALVRAAREASGFPVFLNADHFPSFNACKAAIDCGYDSVLFDGSRQPYEVNVIEAQRVWQYAQTKRGSFMVEGELGYLKGSSEVQEEVTISPADYTKPEQAADFVRRTGVERLAVAFGNIHGIVNKVIYNQTAPTSEVGVPTKASGKEELDIGLLIRIAQAVPKVSLVLHGASGLSDVQVKSAIAAGIVNVHFNTELRVAYAEGLKKELDEKPLETTPYKLFAPAANAVRDLVEQKVKVFMSSKK